ncbi:hypothetical protein ACFC8F_17890 [Streptomyces hydrogenans]|uniref:hypothetical protein n=1 Tax=Streptomyces hydrogenans TaxID=1873719 RepID=UPI0035D7EDD5
MNPVPSTDRLPEIRARLAALPDTAWRQRAGDNGLLEDHTGRPVAVLGTSGDVPLPAGEFIAHAPADLAYLLAEVTRLRCRDAMVTALHQQLDRSGPLLSTRQIATLIGNPGRPHQAPTAADRSAQ